MQLEEYFSKSRELVEEELDRLLPQPDEPPFTVHEAIRWSVFAGGKRFRSLLVLATGEAFGAALHSLLKTACAFEMVHTYSLIHDDLPSMDDDNLRRGRPTCHIKFNEATAILAGDALQTFAFQTIANDDGLSSTKRLQLISELAKAAGTPAGMVAGQAQDIEAESKTVSAEELERIHRLKTGALIAAAARCGAIIAGAQAQSIESVNRYAESLGLLFQITDDLLDVTSTAETMGKTPGKDARSQKATYVAFHGIDAARRRAVSVYDDACRSLNEIDQPTALLHSIADYILHRQK